MAAATPLAHTLVVVGADAALALAVATISEELFPPAGDDREVWKMGAEALAQTALNALLVVETRNRLPQLYSGDPTGGAMVMPLLLALQPKLMDKFRVLSLKLQLVVNSAIDSAKTEN